MSEQIEITQNSVDSALAEALAAVAGASDLTALRALRSTVVGESSKLSLLNAQIKSLMYSSAWAGR